MAAPEARRSRKRAWLLGVLVVLAIGCAGVAGLGWWALRDGQLLGEQEALTPAQIEALGRIKLPAGATNFHAHAGGFQDRFIAIRFDLPPGELDAFLAGTHYTPRLHPTAAVPFQAGIAPDAPWWRPNDAQRFVAGSGMVENIAQTVLVDQTDPERFIVYVQTFET